MWLWLRPMVRSLRWVCPLLKQASSKCWRQGVRPLRLLLKYPVRLALNPFISSVGGLFPHLVSGGAIVAMVLPPASLTVMLAAEAERLLNRTDWPGDAMEFSGAVLIGPVLNLAAGVALAVLGRALTPGELALGAGELQARLHAALGGAQ